MSDLPFVLGIDGGATHVRALAVAASGKVVGYGEGGPCNLSCYSSEQVEASLRGAVLAALGPVDAAATAYAVAGLAGASLPGNAAGYRSILNKLGLSAVDVISDAEAALAAGRSEGAAIVLIAGTGSIACGRDDAGRTARAGGWGHGLGDAGSGAWVGLRAVDAALRALEGRGPRTKLESVIAQSLGLAHVSDVKAEAACGRMTPARLASLAGDVAHAALQGDGAARRIMDEAARELALLAASVGRQLGLSRGTVPVVKAGGMFRLEGPFTGDVQQHLRAMMPEAVLVDPEMTPVQGAAYLALSRAGLAGTEALERLKSWKGHP